MNKANIIRNRLLILVDNELKQSKDKYYPKYNTEDFSVSFIESYSSNTTDVLSFSNLENSTNDINKSFFSSDSNSYLKEICSLFKSSNPLRVIKKAKTGHSNSFHYPSHKRTAISKSPSKRVRDIIRSFIKKRTHSVNSNNK